MVSAASINSFTKGSDKSMDDSSIHGLGGEGGCLGPAGLWGRQPSEPLSEAGSRPPRPRRQCWRSCRLQRGLSPWALCSALQHSPSRVWGDRDTTSSVESVLARLSLKGPAEGDRHRVQSQLPEQRPGWLPGPEWGKQVPLRAGWVPNAVLRTRRERGPGSQPPWLRWAHRNGGGGRRDFGPLG